MRRGCGAVVEIYVSLCVILVAIRMNIRGWMYKLEMGRFFGLFGL